jgi:hypothetical protein
MATARKLAVVNSERASSARALMLACKATTCQWDLLGAAFYVGTSRTGRVIWVHRIRCLRCGSVRVGNYPPHRTRTRDRIGAYRYERPPGWADIQLYYGEALQALVDEQLLSVLDEPPPEEV